MSVPYWRLSGFYFFYFATVGALIPYWSLYLKDSGFNPLEIGQLSALLIGTKIVAPNVWGWIADHTGKSLPIIRFASFFAALLFAGFLFVEGYLEFALITVAFSFFWNASLPQFEATTLFHLKNEPHRYSQIRLWGSIGFIVTVQGIGWLLDSQPIALLPTGITALLVANWLLTLIVPEAPRPVHHGQASTRLWQILKKPAVAAFFVMGMLIHMAHTPYYVFYSIYLQHYHYSATLTGALWALGVVAEIILFIYMKPLLKRFSLRGVLLVSIVLAITRWLMIGWGADYLGVLVFAQLLHAATFGSTHIAAIHLVHDYFGQQHQGKGQALYGSLCMGLGGMLGSLYSGYYWELLAPELIYSASAIACSVALLIAYLWVGREKT